jgi:hypothetical protein
MRNPAGAVAKADDTPLTAPSPRDRPQTCAWGGATSGPALSRAHCRLFGLHVWIPAWCAGRRNDFEMTAAWRRNLHLPVNARRRAYDALRLG